MLKYDILLFIAAVKRLWPKRTKVFLLVKYRIYDKNNKLLFSSESQLNAIAKYKELLAMGFDSFDLRCEKAVINE